MQKKIDEGIKGPLAWNPTYAADNKSISNVSKNTNFLQTFCKHFHSLYAL